MRKYLFCILAMMMLLMIVGTASAAYSVTVVKPASSGIVSGQYTLNASITGVTPEYLVNVSWAVTSTRAGVASTVINATNAINITTTRNFTQLTFKSLLLADEKDYVFTITVKNNSKSAESTTASSTSVILDNYSPQTPSALSPVTKTTRTTNSFSITATILNATECRIESRESPYLTGTSKRKDGTMSGTTCTVTAPSIGWADGYFYYKVIGSDGTNETSLNNQEVKVRTRTSTGNAAVLAAYGQQTQKEPAVNTLWASLSGTEGNSMAPLVFIGIALLVWGYYKKK